MRWLSNPRVHLVILLAVYAIAAYAVQDHCSELLTSDGECYLRMAAYYAHGDFRHALFGHWSPLGAWMAVPLVAMGLEPRYAFRLMIGLWGALAVAGSWRLAGRLGLGSWLRAAATAAAALLALEFSVDHRVDLLLAAALLFYLDAAMAERLLRSRRRALLAGVLGGVAYLAKLYALPFFAAHYTLTVLVRGWVETSSRQSAVASRQGKDDDPGLQIADLGLKSEIGNRKSRMLRRIAFTWAMGMAGFALVATPWVTVLSAKYGRLTFGTAAATAYHLVGPGSGDARTEAITGLQRPPEGAYNVWQDATREPLRPEGGASPSLAEPLRVAGRNSVKILGHLARLDEFRLGLIALAVTPLALVATRREREKAFRYAALLLAVGLFCGGYAFIQAENERYFWFAFFVLTVLAFHFAGGVGRLVPGGRQRRLAVAVVAVAALVSFGYHPVRSVVALLEGPEPGRGHRQVAEQLAEWGVKGPLASIGPRGWWDGLHTAYYLDVKYAGTPRATEPRGIAAEMREAGATVLLVWGDQALVKALFSDPADFEPLGAVTAELLPSLQEDLVILRVRAPSRSVR